MTAKRKFKTADALDTALVNDASIGDFNDRRVFDHAERLARDLAEEHFKTIRSDLAYRRLLEEYEKEVWDFDESLG
ncbi:hypothetical protein [Lactococcus lactis]|uniref:Uncharacterized protein n=1 Tax=Lactococcus lactis subsp. lactis A12 TaxID=1137134 RepID=S6FEN5_LACLL|nr:hypothetical protein [Lactococcus lactis]CDG03731.1 Putative uncharacterized protein [Lactococcus lactis subsp. lactis A12]SBW29616.1 Hypothetical protein LLA12_00441 [Lactococcus lactis subsp. lactis]